MRIAFIEVAGFRGFRNKTRFSFPSGFAVLTGRNGAGKSTILDAVDFVLTGTIHKFAVTNAKGGGLPEHIWWVGSTPADEYYAELGLIDENSEVTKIRRSRFKGLEMPEEAVVKSFCVEHSTTAAFLATLVRTTLIRDETIAAWSLDLSGQERFGELKAALGEIAVPGLTSRMDLLKKAASAARDAQAAKARGLKEELTRGLAALAEARSLAGRNADISEAEAIIARLAPHALSVGRARSEVLRREVAGRRQRLAGAKLLASRLQDLGTRREAFRERTAPAVMAALEMQVGAERARLAAAQKAEQSVREREAGERQRDVLASNLTALIRAGKALGLQSGHCPLCDAELNDEDFAGAIARSEDALKARGSALPEAAEGVRIAVREVENAMRSLASAEARVGNINDEGARLLAEAEALQVEATAIGIDLASVDQAGMSHDLVAQSEDATRLEHALLILESSMAQDRVVELEGVVERVKGALGLEASELAACEQVVDAVDRIWKSTIEVGNQILEEQFDTVLPVLQELYQRLRPHTEWRDISMDFGGSVRASLNFAVGDGRNPQFLFSSGQRRAAGLAFLLALHLSRPWCRLMTLLLDDPVQHIDDYRSLNLVEVLAAIRRDGRQVIVAVEDVALADLLCRRLGGSADDLGRRFEIGTGADGSSTVLDVKDLPPLPAEALLRVTA